MSISDRDRRTIFGLARELGLDDEARRAVQLEVTGTSSIRAMTAADAGRLIAHLRERLGPRRKPPKRAGRAPRNLGREPLLAKIEAQLADLGLSWQYAESIAWRVTGGKGQAPDRQPGVKRLEWVRDWRDLRAVIAALHVEQRKRDELERVQQELARLGKDEAWLVLQLETWFERRTFRRGRWTRDVKLLEYIHGRLVKMESA